MTKAFDECHIAAYGVPSSLMLAAIVMFLLPQILKNAGVGAFNKGYKLEEPKQGDNILLGFYKAVVKNDKRTTKCEKNSYYQVLKIGLLFLPLSVFWSVFEQIGSIWTFQAEELIGWVNLGFFKFYVLNDQVETVNSLLVIILIPLWNYALSPIVDACFYKNRPESKKRKPIHLMLAGLLTAAIAAFLAMRLQNAIDTRLDVMQSSNTMGYDAPVLFKFEDGLAEQIRISDLKIIEGKFMDWSEPMNYKQICLDDTSCVDVLDIDRNGKPRNPVKFLYLNGSGELAIEHISHTLARQNTSSVFDMVSGRTFAMQQEEFESYFGNSDLAFSDGARYAARLGQEDKTALDVTLISEGRSLGVMQILPQYVVITFAEILISVTALEFAYTQAPASMKTLTTALWYTTVALANVLNIILIELGRGHSRSGKLLVSVGAVIVAAVAFYIIGRRYEVLDDKDLVVKFEQSALLDDMKPPVYQDVVSRPGRSIVLDSAGSFKNEALEESREEV